MAEKRKIRIFCLMGMILLMHSHGIGQSVSPNIKNGSGPGHDFQEQLYLHYNKSLLLAGEYLYYKVYALNAKQHTPSTFSKITYVDLVGENNNVVFRHKVRLDQGSGQGDFFIPVDTPTGSYKIIGYTQWMNNGTPDYFFQGDVGIINPFQALKKPMELDSIGNQALEGTRPVDESDLGGLMSISVGKKSYGTRSPVSFQLSASKNGIPKGDYSISVHLMDTVATLAMPSAKQFAKKRVQSTTMASNNAPESIHLPELRGELIWGQLRSKSPDVQLKDQIVALSIPGEKFVLKLTRANAEGRFYFNLNHQYQSTHALVQVLGEQRNNFEITMKDRPSLDYGELTFNPLMITPAMEQWIVERSIYNQVENAFVELKPDTIQTANYAQPVYRTYTTTYDLDDYTRFSTLRETASEVLEHVWVHKNGEGKEELKVRAVEDKFGVEYSPLVLVDGILIQQNDDIIDMDAKQIKSINISRNECVVNSIIYRGIIAIETIQQNFQEGYQPEFIYLLELFSPTPKKNYYQQRYGGNTSTQEQQTPDFRQQLLWLPELHLGADSTTFTFFTSDVPGSYEIRLEGFTAEGIPISVNETFEVKE
nr:hypothetical protein [Allomuricauda sp.]